MSRERVIVEIKDLGQALKVEDTIKTGYCDPIAENLLAWIAVEEDLRDSYGKLLLQGDYASNRDATEAIVTLAEESKTNIRLLHELLDTVEEFGAERDRRRAILAKLLAK